MALVRRAANRDLESRSLLNQTYLFMRLTRGVGSSGFFMSLPIAFASKLAPTLDLRGYATSPVGASLLAKAVYLNHRHHRHVFR
ncbi:Secreted protein [Pseudomonas brassicacearum]